MSDLIIFNFRGGFLLEKQKLFRETQLRDLDRICRYLEVDPKTLGQIKYHVFDTHEEKIDTDPNHSISRAVARYNENAIYRFWDKEEDPSFPHELTHLVAHHFTAPYKLHTEVDQANGEKLTIDIEMVSTCFMQEGLAIAVDDIVFKRKLREDGEYKFIDDWCREQIDKMPKSLAEAMEGFETIPNKIIIPFTASFSKFLLNNYGLEKYKQAYIGQKETQLIKENIKIIEETYKMSAEGLMDGWDKSF